MKKIRSVLAQSIELDTSQAVLELIHTCEQKLAGRMPVAGIIFSGIDTDHQVLVDGILSKWPELQLIGCTTDGEFSNAYGYAEDSNILILLESDFCQMSSGYVLHTEPDMTVACQLAYDEAVNRLGVEPKLCILLSEAIKINGETVLNGLTDAAKGQLPIVGGIAADSWRYENTVQICNRQITGDQSVFLLLGGSFDYAVGMECGWEPYGDMGIITKAEGNTIYEINHKPALGFYHDILGEEAIPSNELPIAIYDETGNFRFMRTSLEHYDSTIGSVTYLGNTPTHSQVKITMVNREGILNGATHSMMQALGAFPKGREPSLAIGFSCSARRALLGTRTKEEFERVREILHSDIPFAGFYTYGEMCPKPKTSLNEFHNETFVTLLLG